MRFDAKDIRILTTQEVADLLRVHRTTVHRYEMSGDLYFAILTATPSKGLTLPGGESESLQNIIMEKRELKSRKWGDYGAAVRLRRQKERVSLLPNSLSLLSRFGRGERI